MNYALITEGIVENIIWLNESNAHEFPTAVALNDRGAGIGDTYKDGAFYRDGVEILTPLETAEGIIAELDAAIVELEYRNILMELGIDE